MFKNYYISLLYEILIFVAQYQTVQVAAQPGMMTLQDGSQVVQTSVANVQMPLFAQQAGRSNLSNFLCI